MSDAKIVGCDNGHFGIKIYAGADKKNQINSRVRIGGSSQTEFGGTSSNSEELVFKTENVEYTTGSMQSEITTFAGYPTSPINRVLVHSCLHQSQFGFDNVDLCLGLPFDQFYSSKSVSGKNEELITSMENNILVPVCNESTGKSIIVNSCITVPEGMAAWFSYIVSEELVEGVARPVFHKERGEQTTVFIDIGGGTTEVVTVSEQKIQKDYSGTIQQGSHRITDDVRRYIYEKTNVNTISERKMHAALKSKQISINGEMLDLNDAITQAQSKLIHKINSYADSILRDIRGDIDAKILVGGTSIDLKDSLMLWKGVELSPDPLYENAKGMYLFKKYLS
jgi:hypothetical protein